MYLCSFKKYDIRHTEGGGAQPFGGAATKKERAPRRYKYMKKHILITVFVLLAFAATAQDSKQTFTRKVVIEQFTTAQCGWCPSGADRITSATNNSSNIVWIKYHAGFGTDDLTNDIAETMTLFYGGSTFAPAMMVDRTRFNESDAGPVGSVGNVSDIRTTIAKAKEVPTYCKVYTPEVGYDPVTRQLTGTVSGRFGDQVYDENTRLVIYLVEDSIFMQQHDYNYGNPANSYAVDYWHMATVRDTITPLWGEALAVDEASNMAFSHSFSYTLPEEYVYKNCRVVAIVYNYDATDINNCAVMNAAQSDFLDQHLGIETAQGGQMRLYPNPAAESVMVEADAAIERISVCNALGQVCLSIEGCRAQQQLLSTSSLANGAYIVRIQTSKGFSARQLVVTK